MADITLVNAAYYENPPGCRCNCVPLGPLYLTSYLEQQGFSVDFRDYQVNTYRNPFDPLNLTDFASNHGKVIGFCCTTDMLPLVISSCRRIKEIGEDICVVLGGPGPSGVAREILENFPFIDAVVPGEGEIPLAELLRQKGNPGEIQGMYYRNGEGVQWGGAGSRLRNLDDFPLPAYERIDWKLYDKIGVIGGRGCPLRCGFCASGSFWKNRSVLRDPQRVAGEMKLLAEKYGRRNLVIADDTLTLNRDWLERFLAAIRRLAPKTAWGCWARVDLVDEDLIKEMASSGCVKVGFGVESGSDHVLGLIGKPFNFDKVMEVIHYSTKYAMVNVNLMWGFPFETWKDFSLTCIRAGAINKLKAHSGGLMLAPLPQTGLFLQYGDQIVFNDKIAPTFARAALAGFLVLEDAPMGPMDLIHRYPGIFPVFYCFPTERLEEKEHVTGKIFGSRFLL